MRVLDVPQKGSRGNTVASRNRFGPFQRRRVSPKQPGTPAQRASWANMKDLSRLWNDLGQERRVAWRRLAEEVYSRPKLSQSGPLDGCQLFKKLNRVLATCGRDPLLDPPPRPAFGPNPVVGFTIRNIRRGLAFKLLLSPKAAADAFPTHGDIMVYSWAPFNAGADKNDLYAFLGLMPTSARGESDITDLYLGKLKQWRKLKNKRYHIPLEGSRIFIRVWQQINGWEHEVGVFQDSALVPADWGRLRVTSHAGRKKVPRQ
jgi:hypothetical protein